jgi:para-nitrobenzyl esterase
MKNRRVREIWPRHCSRPLIGLMAGTAVVILLAGAGAACAPTDTRPTAIAVDGGLVDGTVLPSGVNAYFGIPFAAPPVRELRWKTPQPVASWSGIFHADRKGPECPQRLRNHDINHYFGEEATSEDCLYLNVWAPPTAAAGQKLPVLVFIYGGGFTIGSSGMANYSGESLAKKGAVFVSFNYRIGALGFMAHPELSTETPYGASGNWGLLDQVAALQWINRHIATFGGDPETVTIMGQSAGSASVSYMQSTPLAAGLVYRAFGMSGNAIVGGMGRTDRREAAEAAGVQFQAALGAASVADMRQLSSDRILEAQLASGAPRFQPVVDDHLLPAMPREIFEASQQNDVPLLLGHMRDESRSPLRAATTVAEYQATARQLYGDRAGEFLALYPASSDAEVAEMAGTAAREGGMATTMRSWALAQTATGKAPAYINVFSRVHPYAPGVTFSDHDPATVGAYHTGEVPYWFQTQDAYNVFRRTRDWTEDDRDLADRMSDALITFARTGDPNTPAIAWPRYDPADEQMVEFGDEIRVVPMNTKGLDFFQALQDAGRAPGRGAPPR